jgi:MFS transporter, ACS family, glucarate transporter
MTTTLSTARRTLLLYATTLAAILYLDRVCISQSQGAISAELGLTRTQMGFAMMVFGLAYAIFEVPGGWLGDRIGPRIVLTRVVVWWSAFTVATGWAWNLMSLSTIRFLFGAGEAGCFPNLTRAFTSWFKGAERVRAQSITWFAARWGGAFTPLLVIFTLDYVTWRHSFMIFGSVGFVWAYFFYRWFRNTPAEHPEVSAPERLALAEESVAPGENHEGVPWGPMFSSLSVWLLCLQYACLSYGFWFYLSWLPTYVRESFDLKEADRYLAGLLASLPLFLAGISVWFTGWVTPRLVERFGNVRRVRCGLGFVGHGIASLMLLVSIGLENPVLAMVAMGFSCFGNDMVMPGSWAGCMDMGGSFSGTLSGLMNTFGSVGGLLAPWTIPMILEAAGNNWKVPILVIAVGYAVGALCWLGIDPVTPIRAPEAPPEAVPAPSS